MEGVGGSVAWVSHCFSSLRIGRAKVSFPLPTHTQMRVLSCAAIAALALTAALAIAVRAGSGRREWASGIRRVFQPRAARAPV